MSASGKLLETSKFERILVADVRQEVDRRLPDPDCQAKQLVPIDQLSIVRRWKLDLRLLKPDFRGLIHSSVGVDWYRHASDVGAVWSSLASSWEK